MLVPACRRQSRRSALRESRKALWGHLVLTPNQPQEPDSDGEMDDDQMDHVTLRFVPIDKSILDNAYKQMCYCQELNPCSDMSDEEVDYDEEPVGDMPGASSGVVFNDFGGGFEDAGVQWYGEGTNPDDVQLSSEGMANLQRILGGGVQSDKEDENGDHQMEE
ncbi:hypothetical protein L596_015554 [Steinernema carpocapsae]|uniref:Methylosome subunit pICln n=1 Tax=Steinernema carpocapsae TaxID=34508 RepID=A0A4U5NFB3_STECR|nr:hypothetical protein L596_015554 [Steinernema carpocapsae]